jgi:hypothetical protein|tara:strand:+ start:1549 stop:1767 length:219 start_codon:yes stop_codon:yes gene_type:complete
MKNFQASYEELFPPVGKIKQCVPQVHSNDSKSNLLSILGVVLLVSVAGFVAYQISKKKKKKENSLPSNTLDL